MWKPGGRRASRKERCVYRLGKGIVSSFVLLSVVACSKAPSGWSAREQKDAGQEMAEALFALAGGPPTPLILVWGKDGKPLPGFSDQLKAFEDMASPLVEVVDVSAYGKETDMMSVPSEALAGMDTGSVVISLAGPVSGIPPSTLRYVCLLPTQWLQAGAALPGLYGALIPTTQDLPGLSPPTNGSTSFRSQYRVFQAR